MEKEILKAFLYNHELRFSDIEKKVRLRSNKLAYHIKNLVKKGVLEKSGDFYKLTEVSENLIPYLSDKQSPLPVILIALQKDSNNLFLYPREKRPFKGKFSLPGGRLLKGESIIDSVKRIMKDKHNLCVDFKKVNSVSLEQVFSKNKIIHSFLLIFVSVTSKDNINYINVQKQRKNIISSDFKLIKKDLKKRTIINNLFTLT